MRSIERRYSTATGSFADRPTPPLIGRAGKVSAPEFTPLLKAEPSVQFGAGTDIFQPSKCNDSFFTPQGQSRSNR